MEALMKSKDSEIKKLLVDNRQLTDELRQCQADKEFVWSLWKRLQVSSPDLTQAISIVMEREREKTEVKDRKVMELLKGKDEEIRELHKTVSDMKEEKDELFKSKVSLEVEQDTRIVSIQGLEKEIKILKDHLEKCQIENQEKSESYERTIEEIKTQREDLKIKSAEFLTDIQEMRCKIQDLEEENVKLKERNLNLYNELYKKEESLTLIKEEKESVVSELERVLRDYSHVRSTVAEDVRSRDQRYSELKTAYEELTEHNQQQLVIINQLQNLQSSTKQVLSEQEEAYRNEKKTLQQVNRDLLDANDNLKEKESNLKKENETLRKRINIQESSLKESEEELRKAIAMASIGNQNYHHHDYRDLEDKIEEQRNEIAALQRKLKSDHANRRLKSPHKSDGMIDHTFSPIVERGLGRQQTRSRSLSPCSQSRQLHLLQKRLKATETKLDDTKQLLELKKDEVREIQRAHNKRLERLKILQSDYRSLKSGREDEETISPRKRKQKYRRNNPKELRYENSEAVWNELARYKQDNRALSMQRISLEEELDALRVQAAMDRATIQDLNICLKQERDELTSKIRTKRQDEDRLCSTPKKLEGNNSNRNVKNLERKLENAAEDNKLLKKDKKRLLQENKSLKDDIKSLKLELTDTRQNFTQLRLESSELRRQLERFKSGNDQLDGDLNHLKTEVEQLRDESDSLRSENLSLRDENSELRQEVADLKLEVSELNAELKDLERSAREMDVEMLNPRNARSWHSPSAKKHQKFLNQSVQEMQAAFGNNFTPDPSSAGEDVTIPEDVGRSDASSLGQNIVRASRRQKRVKKDLIDEDKDEDETLAGESVDTQRSSRISNKRPSSVPRRGDGSLILSLKQRLTSLQTQCNALRTAKQNVVKKVNEEKQKNVQLESELTSCQNKMKNFKQTIQRLNREVEILQREREDLQKSVMEMKSSKPEPPPHNEADYKYLESKFKLAASETTRLSEQLKEIKKDFDKKTDQLISEKERNTRLERDVSMKRQLIDELRVKSKEHETKLKDEYNAKLDVEEKLKTVEEDLSHKKNHIESIRRQLQACTKEKAKYEMMYNKSREEIDKRSEQLSSAHAGRLEAENATSRMEQEAEYQLQTLASRSEQALEKLKSKLERSEEKLVEFSIFVQTLSSHMVELLCRQRENLSREKSNIAEQQARLSNSGNKRTTSMSHAQKVACDILNMSQSDFEDLMAPVNTSKKVENQSNMDCTGITQLDETWKSRVEKIATENPPFAKSLSRLLWDKIQDIVRLTEERCQVRTDHLEDELMSRKKL